MSVYDPGAIALRLRQARQNAGYSSAADAAGAMDLAYGTYAAHENGHRGITLESAIKYAAFFKVSLAWLAVGQLPSGSLSELAGLSAEAQAQVRSLIQLLRRYERLRQAIHDRAAQS